MAQRNYGNNLEPEIQQNNVYKIKLYLSENADCFFITNAEGLMLFRETVAVYCENYTEHRDTLCGQNAVYIRIQTVPHRKHITSLLQSPTG
jgi:hypothetical protein